MLYRFGDFVLDAEAFSLAGPSGAVPIEPLVFDLLHCFARRPNTLLTRDTLIEEVWKGRIVSDATLSSAIKAARKALGDSGEAQRLIRTVRGRGFQFVADVAVESVAAEERPVGALSAHAPPSLSVGPLRAIGAAPELGGLADALAGNLATILTRVPLLQVSMAEAPGGGSTLLQLRGELREVRGTFHANIQLIDTRDGHLFWGRVFQQPITEDAATGLLDQILPRLEPQLVRAVGDGLAGDDARTLLIKATGALSLKGWSRQSFEDSARMLRDAIARDEGLALAHAQLALILALGARFGLLFDELAADEAARHADRALELDDFDSTIAGAAGCALADIGQTRRARPLLKKAIDLNPNNAQAWAAMGALHLLEGEFDAAARNLEKGLAISPMDPRRSVWGGFLASVHIFRNDVEAALEASQTALEHDGRNYMAYLTLAAASLLQDDAPSASAALRDARRVRPDFTHGEMIRLLGEAMTARLEALEPSAKASFDQIDPI